MKKGWGPQNISHPLVMKQRTTSMSVRPRCCFPGLSPVWQEGSGISLPTVSLRRPTRVSLRCCCVSSFSFLCYCYFPFKVSLLLYSLSRLKVVGITILLCSVCRADLSGMVHNTCCVHNEKQNKTKQENVVVTWSVQEFFTFLKVVIWKHLYQMWISPCWWSECG